jgi:hypothetical protein
MMALLDYRKEQVKELAAMRQKLDSVQAMRRDFPGIAAALEGTAVSAEKLAELSQRIEQRLSRVRENTCRVAVIGLEKAGKSTFINAWIGGQALPADRERCTWAASTIRNGSRIQAEVIFSTREDFDADVKKLYEDAGLDRGKIPFPLPKDAPSMFPELLPPKITKCNEYNDLKDLSDFWSEISPQLGRGKYSFTADSVPELRKKIFPYISRLEEGGRKIGTAYAVKQVNIDIPLEDNLEFTIDDLPGVNAPGNRAEEMTFKALRETADVIVFIKNAAANASHDRDETRIWKEADEADTSIKLTERLFVVMSRADESAVDNGRDAHKQGAQAFIDKGVSPAHVFYCSSTAAIYRAYKEHGGDIPTFMIPPAAYSERDYEDAAKKIAGYLGAGEPTSGIREFERALYGFLKEDFPGLERRALESLRAEYAKVIEKARELIEAYEREQLSENTNDAENQRFEALWRRYPVRGLADEIQYEAGTYIAPILTDSNAGFLDEIRLRLAASRDRFLETITVDQFELMAQRDPATSFRRDSHMKSLYFGVVQQSLKTEIYERLAADISQNVTGHLEPIWEKALCAKTAEAPQGLEIIPAGKREEELRKALKKRPNQVLEQLFPPEGGNSPTITAAGFAAILKSIIQAPAEYLLNSESSCDPVRERLLQKAILYRNGICDEKTKSRLASHCAKFSGETGKDRNSDFIEMVKGDPALVRDVLDLFLPRSFVTLASAVLKAAGKLANGADAQTRKTNPFAEVKTETEEQNVQPAPAETPEAVVEELKQRVQLFYFVLESMLFDQDFGFIGYYRSFLEEFRSAIIEEMEPGGVIKALASRFRREVWPNEAEFRANDERRRVEEKMARFKQELGEKE